MHAYSSYIIKVHVLHVSLYVYKPHGSSCYNYCCKFYHTYWHIMIRCIRKFCSYCDFCYFNEDVLVRHTTQCHGNDANFIIYCSYCHQSFRNQESLRKHIQRLHANMSGLLLDLIKKHFLMYVYNHQAMMILQHK